jgi:hypothetical protein
MSIFRSTFAQEISDQLKIRGKSIKERNPKGLQFFNGRNAWVKMTSGADIDDGNGGYSQAVARGHSLIAGEAILDNKDGIHIKKGLGILGNAYSSKTLSVDGWMDNQRGIRPMPGITGVEIQSKSAYGSLRQATISFVCHDIKQLETLELLYMRPGFTVLLEWGWTPYLTNDGNLKSNIEFYNDIWKSDLKNKDGSSATLQDRFANLYQKSKSYYGNYDAMLGYVKNYEWSARMDGGFDCRTELISIGEILESLKVNYTPVNIPITGRGLLSQYINADLSEKSQQIKTFYEKNIIAGVLSELIFYGYKQNLNNKGTSFQLNDNTGNISGDTKPLEMFGININNKNGSSTNKIVEDNLDSEINVYMDLESFIKVLNKNVNAKDKRTGESLVPLSLKGREYNNETFSMLCLSHPLQISVDPTICLIKNINWKNLKKINIEVNNISTVLPTPDNIPASIRNHAYQAIINYNKFSNENDTNEAGVLDVLTNYYNEFFGKGYTAKQASSYLSDAYQEYKFKTFKINPIQTSSQGGLFKTKNYTIGNSSSPLYSVNVTTQTQAGVTSDPDQNQFESSRDKIANYTLSQQLVNDLANKSDNSLQKLLDQINPKVDKTKYTQSEAKGAAYELFRGDQSVEVLASENITKRIDKDAIDTKINQSSSDVETNLTFLETLNKDYFYSSPDGKELGSIGGIYVNLGYALNLSLNNELENNDRNEKKEINLYDYLKALMKGIQDSTGGLNNFDIHVDPIDSIARIIDVHYVDERNTQEVFNTAFTFMSPDPTSADNLDGLFNNIRSYKMSSLIFKEQSSIVAISAQNGGGQMGLDNETLVGWNRGIVDRIIPEKGSPQGKSITTKDGKVETLNNLNTNLSIIKTYIEDLGWIEDLNLLGLEFGGSDRKYNSENADKYKHALRDLIMEYKALTSCDAKFKSIIPVKLSIELDGIGGLVIGNIFRMPNDLLPLGYKVAGGNLGRRLGYLITGIGHSISKDWVTRIEAQTIILEEPPIEDTVNIFSIISEQSVEKVSIDISSNVDAGKIKVKFNQTIEDRVKTVIQLLQAKGYNNIQIAAITGNFLHESELNPNAFNSAGGGQGAYGIAQWRAGRQSALKKLSNYDTLQTQIDYVHKEIQSDPVIIKALQARTVQEAALAFEATYERSGGSGLLSRQTNAIYVYNTFLNK